MTVGLNSSAPCKKRANSTGEIALAVLSCPPTDCFFGSIESLPISTIVSGTLVPVGGEFFNNHRRNISSKCCNRGSRKKNMQASKMTSISQMDGRCIEQEVKSDEGHVTSEKQASIA